MRISIAAAAPTGTLGPTLLPHRFCLFSVLASSTSATTTLRCVVNPFTIYDLRFASALDFGPRFQEFNARVFNQGILFPQSKPLPLCQGWESDFPSVVFFRRLGRNWQPFRGGRKIK